MARVLSRLDQLAFADLVEKCHDAAFAAEFPANGALLKQMRRGRAYWYYRGYERAPEAGRGVQTLKYVGPAGDPEIERRVTAFANLRADYRARRELAARLRRAGLPAPLPFDGAVLAALAAAGVFRLRAVLVGSSAYQTYSGLIGVRLPDALHATEDMDFAQDYGISVALDDQTAPLGAALQTVDPSFAPFEKGSAPGLSIGFRNARGFKVEFLTTHRGDRAHGDGASLLPALAVGAQPLEFLDYLIRDRLARSRDCRRRAGARPLRRPQAHRRLATRQPRQGAQGPRPGRRLVRSLLGRWPPRRSPGRHRGSRGARAVLVERHPSRPRPSARTPVRLGGRDFAGDPPCRMMRPPADASLARLLASK